MPDRTHLTQFNQSLPITPIFAPYPHYPPQTWMFNPDPSNAPQPHVVSWNTLPHPPPQSPAPTQTQIAQSQQQFPPTLPVDPFSNWQWIPAWKCPMTGALWTPLQPLVSATLPNPPLHPPEVPPALRFWIPFLASILHQHLNPPIPTGSQVGGSVRNSIRTNVDLAPKCSAIGNHLATPPGVEVNTEWLHLPESLDDAILLGKGMLQDIVHNPTSQSPWLNSKSLDQI